MGTEKVLAIKEKLKKKDEDDEEIHKQPHNISREKKKTCKKTFCKPRGLDFFYTDVSAPL